MSTITNRAERIYRAIVAINQPESQARLSGLVSLLRNHIVDDALEDADVAISLLDEIIAYSPTIKNATAINVVPDLVRFYDIFAEVAAIDSQDATVIEAVGKATTAMNFVYSKLTYVAENVMP